MVAAEADGVRRQYQFRAELVAQLEQHRESFSFAGRRNKHARAERQRRVDLRERPNHKHFPRELQPQSCFLNQLVFKRDGCFRTWWRWD